MRLDSQVMLDHQVITVAMGREEHPEYLEKLVSRVRMVKPVSRERLEMLVTPVTQVLKDQQETREHLVSFTANFPSYSYMIVETIK